jgi:hypothetical protein|uniref:Uncharacterized protein n=1 Tax=Picea glauca TaxID=3330 RepID=A0A124GMJ4_PICGL|nr:hypothetical protein ABT39_MTgene2216 [Picea glauca]QHR86646.1 hypothetical protein Q903MT_gene649 [Picea sitchensis]
MHRKATIVRYHAKMNIPKDLIATIGPPPRSLVDSVPTRLNLTASLADASYAHPFPDCPRVNDLISHPRKGFFREHCNSWGTRRKGEHS